MLLFNSNSNAFDTNVYACISCNKIVLMSIKRGLRPTSAHYITGTEVTT